MTYTLIRSDRKTICIQLTPAGELIVRAPKRCKKSDIDAFVDSKAGWIASHQTQIQARNTERDAFFLQDGDTISICGMPYCVRLQGGPAVSDGQILLPSGDMDAVRGEIFHMAQEIALPWIQTHLTDWADKMNISFSGWKFSSAQKRWGSCTSEGVIRISVYLLFAPERAVDYVLVHELAHRKQFDHSPAFWEIISAAMPDYKAQRQALRTYQNTPFVQSLAKR